MLEFDWTIFINYGALGCCLAYFIYKDLKTNKEIRDSLEQSGKETRETLNGVKDALNNLKEVITVLKEIIKKD